MKLLSLKYLFSKSKKKKKKFFVSNLYTNIYIYLQVQNILRFKKYIRNKTLTKIIQILLIIFNSFTSKTKRTVNIDLSK